MASENGQPLLVHIGCGSTRLADWVNCDLYPGPGVDEVFDVQGPWPFPDDSVTAIYASHILEHLRDPGAFFREVWRVLKPEGSNILLRMPYGAHRAAWWDIEHVRPWFAESFCFLQPGYAEAIGNPQHRDWTAFFKIELAELRLGSRVAGWLRRRWLRRWLLPWADVLFESQVEELWIHAVPLKTERDIHIFRQMGSPYTIPMRYVMYRHHLEGRMVARQEPTELIPLAEGQTQSVFVQIGD